jgi:ribose/xylose/arabinose/galactoside ABC-type transport system permease subunit
MKQGSVKAPRELPIVILLLVVIGLMTAFVPAFKSADNLKAVGENAAYIGIMALGEGLVIIGAGLDLSVGSVMALACCTMAIVLHAEKPWPLALAAGLLVSTAAGALNGLLITRRALPPILTTLATLLLFRHGISLATHAKAFTNFPDAFKLIGSGWTPLVVFVLLTVAAMVTLNSTRLGRWTLAIGGSEQSARLSGVPVARIKMAAYALSGLTAAIGGWIVMAYNDNAQSSVGTGYELDVIAACVVGGIRITGGDGSLGGAALGAILIALLRNALILTDRPIEQYGLFTGAVILSAALLEGWRARRKARKLQAQGGAA